MLYCTSSRVSKEEFDSGDFLLSMISEQFVKVKANNMPAEMKSSRSAKGTNVAKNVITAPANSAPFLGLLFESTSLNIWGRRPSLARANCSRGCINSDTNTTMGRVMTSPAYGRTRRIRESIEKVLINLIQIVLKQCDITHRSQMRSPFPTIGIKCHWITALR